MRAGWVAIIGGSTLDRGQVQRDFQAGKYRGLAGTIGAASTALTLTLATRELFIDRAWVPADNDQAEDRAHRIGQTAGLIIVDLVAEHPIDRHVHILNHRKRGIIRASIGRVRGNRDVNLPLLRAIERAGKK
jgi:SNF2 family DNA or RNA helicase